MKLPICNFEIVKQLKEIGFDFKCLDNDHIEKISSKKYISAAQRYAYDWNNKLKPHKTIYKAKELNQKQLTILAPTLALVQMRLREKYDINIFINCEMNCSSVEVDWFKYKYQIYNGRDWINRNIYNRNDSYDQALEAGILEAIKLIKTKQK
jgi:uridine kinase